MGQASELEALKKELEGVQEASQLAAETLGMVGDSFSPEQYIAKVDEIGQAWQDAMVDASGYWAEQDGIATFDWSQYLSDAEFTIAQADEYKRRLLGVPSDISREAEDVFADQGPTAANAYLTAYESASAENKARFEAVAKANSVSAGEKAGREGAKAQEKAAIEESKNWGPLGIPVKVSLIDDTVLKNYIPPSIKAPVTWFDKITGKQLI
jgi:hypothetical protein